ncbi:T9SS type A sorting domain-containing protein [Flavobacterium sp. XS2P24]|uniref:T9SS type A sorting domain-containing protein n=1 Tax=Flavobacterium sp. XS2P24 TaxID=3041249 RepID=UPI0024A8A067|nr:LamG-like jellyroll fold domain-containing protein [Flavobacterium sp. XS2P24]MDI6050811.1 T9SS type A sorting domain-containing protein [Flavobacterium sp. XS2P24]
MSKTLLFKRKIFLVVSFLFITLLGLAQTQTYNNPANNGTAAHTFIVPTGVTSVTLAAWGGGGGGGGSTSNGSGGGGGGGGGAATSTINVAATNTFTVVVGSGGAGGATTPLATGSTGDQSRITATTPSVNILANGGTGAIVNSGLGSNGGAGDTASGGSIVSNGENGTNGNTSGQAGGNSGTVLGIFGSGGGAIVNNNGNVGSAPGGGGGGGEASTGGGGARTGGAGGNGQVIIRYITVTAATSPLCVGGTITIDGSGFSTTGTTTVLINGTACTSVNVVSSTRITAVVATGTTSGTIVVTNPNGTNDGRSTTINPSPTANEGAALAAICNTSSTVALGGSFGGAATSAVWSDGGVGGTLTNNSGSTPNTTTWTPPAGYVGTATLTLTTAGGSCANATASKMQVVNGPIANAGPALTTICQGVTTSALGGSFGGTATSAVWSDGGVGGSFINNTGSTPNTATWTPPAAYTGTATLNLTTSGGACGTTTASKTQVVSTGSFATVGSAMTITGSLTSTSLGGNTPSPGSGAWTKISGPSGTVTFSNSTSGTSTATVPSLGTYVFRWTVTSTCGTSSADITVTYLDANTHRDYTLFYEDFDASNGDWSNSTTTNGSWLWTSSFPATIAEIGENSFWRLNNYNTYNNSSVIEIDSPIYNFTGYENLLFNIDVRYDTEANRDGMRILYSINGAAFVQLGTSGTGINWYNSASVSALGSNGWSDNHATATLQFTPIGVGADRFTRATTTLADATFRNQSNVRFRVQFKSDGTTNDVGVAFDNVSVEGNPMVALALSPIAPAKVNQNLSLWFKSNAGIAVTDGTALTAWEDQAYDTTRADLVNKESVKALANDAPTFRDNSTRNINFNPVVDFNAVNKDYMNGKGGLYSQDYFIVVYSNDVIQNTTGSNGRQIPLGGKSDDSNFHEDPTGLGLGNTTARYSTSEVIAHNIGAYAPGTGSPTPGVDSYGRAFSSTTITYNEPLIINVKTNATGTQTEIYKNGIQIDNTAGKTGNNGDQQTLNFYEYRNLPFYLGTGRSGISGRTFSALNGRLSEVVAYTAPNSALNQQKIQSYLGLKYGITLHATGSSNVSGVSTTSRLNDVDYIDSDGNIIWNTSANSGFNYDIAGIGRDDNSQLNQKQSKSVHPHTSTAYDDDITIGLTTIAATNNLNTNTFGINKNFLIWGNNNGSLVAQAPVVVNISSGITPALTTNVDFVSIGRTWKVVETGGNMPAAKVSIPTNMLTNTITPPGDYLMFISNTPVFNPTAEYRVMTVNGSNLETTYDFNGAKYITFGYAPERTEVRCIKFDGVDDYLDAGKVLNLNTSFTVSAWVNRNSTNKTILSKRNSTFTEGYDLSINTDGKAEMSWMVGGTKHTITSNVVIPSGKWHHIGIIYNSTTTTAKMYIDGVTSVSNNTMPNVPATTQSFLIAAADGAPPTSLFNGSIDEVRVWNIALTEAQFRYVMNQEILSNTTFTNGTIVPNAIPLNDISSVQWANLNAYYPMSTYTYTNAKDISSNNYTAALRNLTTVDLQTAPLPYESATNGNWETVGTWTNSTVQDLPYSTSIEDPSKTIDWNIVKTSHNITSVGNKTVLGLFVNSNTLTATTTGGLQTDGTKIEVSHYLKLDGKIDLAGRSQLIQKLGSDLDATSSGSLERDQQGQANKFNYNYWSSPVGAINATTNNNSFTVAGVLKDGTNPAAPETINWINGYDGATSPFSLARFWIYKFDNLGNDYANWTQIGETGTLSASKGFTLKGPGTSGTQNLTFLGKPNNGTINNTVGADQLLLIGNPYPSALDADKFINDNIGSIETSTSNPAIDGALYFWEHYASNNSHNLAAYQGGYAIRNLSGGLAPSATGVDFISGAGTASKLTPNRFIPIGQGFFVIGRLGSGGTVTFNNSQREFIIESNALSQELYRIPVSPKTSSHWTDNSNAPIEKDSHKKIRLGFNVIDKTFHRQVLLAFMDEKANSEINDGYDAFNIDDSPSDMYLLNGENELAIQGEGYFDEDASFPIAVRTEATGKVSFGIDALENFDQSQNVFIYDKETDTYNSIKNKLYEVELPQGYFTDRFSLRFTDKTLGVKDVIYENSIQVAFTRSNNVLNITNGANDNTVVAVSLFNIQGKLMSTWDVSEKEQTSIKIPIQNKTSGVYIVKLKTSKGNINKKIIIK